MSHSTLLTHTTNLINHIDRSPDSAQTAKAKSRLVNIIATLALQEKGIAAYKFHP
jgi:hypothetical protein